MKNENILYFQYLEKIRYATHLFIFLTVLRNILLQTLILFISFYFTFEQSMIRGANLLQFMNTWSDESSLSLAANIRKKSCLERRGGAVRLDWVFFEPK